jgi:hypothetical protein
MFNQDILVIKLTSRTMLGGQIYQPCLQACK